MSDKKHSKIIKNINEIITKQYYRPIIIKKYKKTIPKKNVVFGGSEQARTYDKTEYDRSSIHILKDNDFFNEARHLRRHYKYMDHQRKVIIQDMAKKASQEYSKLPMKKNVQYPIRPRKIASKSPDNSPRNSIITKSILKKSI